MYSFILIAHYQTQYFHTAIIPHFITNQSGFMKFKFDFVFYSCEKPFDFKKNIHDVHLQEVIPTYKKQANTSYERHNVSL